MAFFIKAGVQMNGLMLPMRKVLIAVESIYKRMGYDTVVTSALDGTHSAGSLHYYGYALDFRTRHVAADKISALVDDVKKALGPNYFVLFEGDHLHVDYRAIIKG